MALLDSARTGCANHNNGAKSSANQWMYRVDVMEASWPEKTTMMEITHADDMVMPCYV